MNHILKLTLFLFTSVFLQSAQPTVEQFQSIQDLIEENKIEQAKVKVDSYLEFFPNDAQLIAMKEVLTAFGTTALSMTDVDEVAKPQPISPADLEEIKSVLALLDEMTGANTFEGRYDTAYEIYKRPVPDRAYELHEEWVRYWIAKSVACLTLNQYGKGWEYSQHLLKLGAGRIANDAVKKVMSQLQDKGWLNPNKEEVYEQAKNERRERFKGVWSNEVTKHWSSGDYKGVYTVKEELRIAFPDGKREVSYSQIIDYTTEWWDGSAKLKSFIYTTIPGQFHESNKSPVAIELNSVVINEDDPRVIRLKFTEGGVPAQRAFMLSADGSYLYILRVLPNEKRSGSFYESYASFHPYIGKKYITSFTGTFDRPEIIRLDRQ
ncbi:hypothetical protein QEH59_17955 [Coraliomargarita sp. SDUM461004]|uniref:TNase-like domain-containing protein n=1 Tax=Thalassobacterium sedimentorum TaxID=3041258 RepID=A0ABU1ANF4_9BACT|nr:hypothetical protein [Coraliomargarita sp. SDUM461004]MDQ8196325.1 hypothetical protein [Coraliomargarita sp. SDUM461004]